MINYLTRFFSNLQALKQVILDPDLIVTWVVEEVAREHSALFATGWKPTL